MSSKNDKEISTEDFKFSLKWASISTLGYAAVIWLSIFNYRKFGFKTRLGKFAISAGTLLVGSSVVNFFTVKTLLQEAQQLSPTSAVRKHLDTFHLEANQDLLRNYLKELPSNNTNKPQDNENIKK